MDAYRSPPRRIHAGPDWTIPVFADSDDYVKNYEKISADHLSVHEKRGINPFMAEDFWNESEGLTAGLVRKLTPVGGALLDVGCGMGRLLTKLSGYQRYGMDISVGYLAYAVKTGADVCLARVEDMPYRDNYFDTVVCTDVLEHVLDLNVAVSQLLRVVRSGGHVVIRVPYRENLEPYLRSDYPYDMAHLRNFDEHSLRLLFEKIFKCTVVDEVRGPYLEQGQYFKWPIQFRGLGFALRSALQISSFFSSSFKLRLVRLIFRPVEISVAIKKP